MAGDESREELERELLATESEKPLIDDTEADIEPKESKAPRKGSISAEVIEALMAGATEQELVNTGYNAKTVRMIAQKLEKENKRMRTPGSEGTKRRTKAQIKSLVQRKKEELEAEARGEEVDNTLLLSNKALPAESLIKLIKLPVTGLVAPLEQGIKIGMNLVVLGVRLSQEMSSIGIQQSRPLLAMAREMRSGELAAADAASKESAVKVANQLAEYLAPQLQAIVSKVEDNARAIEHMKKGEEPPKVVTGDAMKDMTARIMEPLLKGMVSKIQKGMFPGVAVENTPPSGWTISRKE